MLTLHDCMALCELTEDEVQAIARHEHLSQIAAIELGDYLARSPAGELCIKDMMRDDIRAAEACGERERSAALKLVLRGFILKHPCCEARRRPRESLS